MIVVGFLICVAAGYFVQPAARRAALRMSKSYRQQQSQRRHQRKAARREYSSNCSSSYDELLHKAKCDMAKIAKLNEEARYIKAQIERHRY